MEEAAGEVACLQWGSFWFMVLVNLNGPGIGSMRKTTAKYSGSIVLWLLVVSPVALVLAIERWHPDFQNRLESYGDAGPLWSLAMFMSGRCLIVIWLGAVLVVLAIWRWRRTAIVCRILLGMMALASTAAAVVVAARYWKHYAAGSGRFAWWLHGIGIDRW